MRPVNRGSFTSKRPKNFSRMTSASPLTNSAKNWPNQASRTEKSALTWGVRISPKILSSASPAPRISGKSNFLSRINSVKCRAWAASFTTPRMVMSISWSTLTVPSNSIRAKLESRSSDHSFRFSTPSHSTWTFPLNGNRSGSCSSSSSLNSISAVRYPPTTVNVPQAGEATGGAISLQVLVDRGVLEVCGNDGRVMMSFGGDPYT
ncbi:MAG: GH32 C-terminal domain-containing protein, partial [Candidatus Aminicenantaceae bacterium]